MPNSVPDPELQQYETLLKTMSTLNPNTCLTKHFQKITPAVFIFFRLPAQAEKFKTHWRRLKLYEDEGAEPTRA